MTRLGVLKNLRQLSMQTESEAAEGVEEILKALASLNYTELWDVLVDRNGLQSLLKIRDPMANVIWKSQTIEKFIDDAWEKGPPPQGTYDHMYSSSRGARLQKLLRIFKTSVCKPSLLWISHVLYNAIYFVLLTIFIYSDSVLVEYPHPFEIALACLFFIPTLLPPYHPTVIGHLTIDILFLISFIFRGIAHSQWPFPSMDAINLLLNGRTLLSFLPLIQMLNVVLIAFPLPRLGLIFRLLYPLFPMAVLIFIGFFLSFHFLSDTHYPVQHTFDVLLRTILLDIHAGAATQFHPVAARIVYYLFGFMALYLFWGVGIAGVGMKLIVETDWQAERVRGKAIRLLRHAPVTISVQRKRLLGKGKVLSSAPFNVFEGSGILFRLRWLRNAAMYLFALPVVLGWSLALGVIYLFQYLYIGLRMVGAKIMDEEEDEVDDSDGEAMRSEETEALLSEPRHLFRS